MPSMDGTGPMGKGPKTGRGLGNCPIENNTGFCGQTGRGLGRGRGCGLGWRRNVNNQASTSEPSLKQYKNELEAELNRINSILKNKE